MSVEQFTYPRDRLPQCFHGGTTTRPSLPYNGDYLINDVSGTHKCMGVQVADDIFSLLLDEIS